MLKVINKFMKKLITLGLFVLVASLSFGQTTLLGSEAFSSGLGIFTANDANWTSTNPTSTAPPGFSSSGYTGASGGNAGTLADNYTPTTNLTSSSFSTLNKNTVTVTFSEWLSSPSAITITDIILQYSTDNGTTWTSSSFSSTATDVTYNTLKTVILPPLVNGYSQVKLRFTLSGSGFGFGGLYYVDDFKVVGTTPPPATNFYNKSVLDPTLTTSWGTSTDGTGTAPVSFILDNQVFNLINGASSTLSTSWTISGTNSKLKIGDGTSIVTLNTGIFNYTGKVYIYNKGTLSLGFNPGVTVFDTLATGSTVDYSRAGGQPIKTGTYSNLTISGGSGAKTISSAVTVNGILNLSTVGSLSLTSTLNINRTVTGTMPITGGALGATTSVINVNRSGGGTVGTLYFNSSGALFNFIITSGDVTLGSNLQIDGAAASTPVLSIASGASLDGGSFSIKGSSSLTESVVINGTFKTANTAGLNSGASTAFDLNLTPTLSSSTIEYNATSGSQIITPFPSVNAYNNLTLSGAATKTFSASSYFITKDFVVTGGTPSISSSATFEFSGASVQALAAMDYPTLTLSGSGNKTLSISDTSRISTLVTINGTANLVTNGRLLLKADGAGTNVAQLLDNTISGGVSGNVSIQRVVGSRSGSQALNGPAILLSSPVNGNLSQFTIKYGTNRNFYYYDPSLALGSRYTKVDISTPAIAGKGYLYRALTGDKYYLSGTVNNGDITQNLIFAGDNMNLIGNPYPSAITWDPAKITMTNLAGGNSYSIFDGVAYVSKTTGTNIPLGQGFFVQAASSGASVVFKNIARLANQAPLYRLENDINNRTELWIYRGSKFHDMAVTWGQNGASSNTYKNVFDGDKLMPVAEAPSVNFIKGNKNLTIFSFGTEENKVKIPVITKLPIDTVYSFELKNLEKLDPAYNVYLVDSTLNIIHDLRSNNKYTFNGNASNTSRFSIVFNTSTVTSINETQEVASQMTVFSDRKEVYFNVTEIPNNLIIRDLKGNIVYKSSNFDAKSFSINLPYNEGIYIATVETSNQVINKKFILKY